MFQLISGRNNILKAIKTANSTRAKYQELMHQLAVSCLVFKEENSQTVDLINTLIDGIDSPKEKGSLERWFCTYAACKATKEGLRHAKGKAVQLQDAIVNPYFMEQQNRAEKAQKEWNQEVAATQLVSLLDRRAKIASDNGATELASKIRQAASLLVA